MPTGLQLLLALLALWPALGNEENFGHLEKVGELPNLEAEAEGSHHEHQEEAPDPTNLAVAAMLLGSVVFNMSIFYLVNHHDPDIKHNSWAVLSSTIAIFVSVLLFNGIQGVMDLLVETFVQHLLSEQVEQQVFIWSRYLQFVLWYLVMYSTLRRQATESFDLVHRSAVVQVSQTPEMDMHQRLTCWQMLFAHMSGFAAISGGAALQGFGWFAEYAWLSLVPVLVTLLLEFLLFLSTDHILEKQKHTMSEGVWHLVDEYGDDAETDVAGLSLSYLLVQSLTFIVLGDKPAHGESHESALHELRPVSATLWLIGLSLVFVALTMGLVWLSAKVLSPGLSKLSRRWFANLQTVVAMSFAWCLLHAFEWEVSRFLKKTIHAEGVVLDSHATIQRVLLAMSVSFVSLAMIFALDYLHDLPVTGDLADRAIKKVIMAIGILIGFSWEEAFDAGCEAFAELAGKQWGVVLLKLLLGLTVAVVVVPAWRLYILHNLLMLEQKERDAHPSEAEDGEGPHHHYGPKENKDSGSSWFSFLKPMSLRSYQIVGSNEQPGTDGARPGSGALACCGAR